MGIVGRTVAVSVLQRSGTAAANVLQFAAPQDWKFSGGDGLSSGYQLSR